jgi:UDP-N-acetylglucosamine 2-epimerase
MRIVSIVGARPQLVKAAAVSRCLRERHTELLVHTGQHYDYELSQVFFDELGVPAPDVNLGVGSGPPGAQTGSMIAGIEAVLAAERPDRVLVYGDTNSTLAGALAAAKLALPLVHVEAGLRSFDRHMPEEINRVIADRLSDLLLCPSQTAVDNLEREGIRAGVHLIGDVMADLVCALAPAARSRSEAWTRYGVEAGRFVLATVHRAENTDDPGRLRAIIEALNALDEAVIFLAHPRTRRVMETQQLTMRPHVRLAPPVGYLDMLALQQAARLILTDSGGLQKEAYWLGVPCVTVRDVTEWTETVDAGWNVLTGADRDRIVRAVRTASPPAARPPLYGAGDAVRQVVTLIGEELVPAGAAS